MDHYKGEKDSNYRTEIGSFLIDLGFGIEQLMKIFSSTKEKGISLTGIRYWIAYKDILNGIPVLPEDFEARTALKKVQWWMNNNKNHPLYTYELKDRIRNEFMLLDAIRFNYLMEELGYIQI